MLQTLWRKFDRDWGWNLARLLAYTCIQTLFAVLGLQLIVLSLVLRLLAPAAEQGFIAHILRLLPDHVTIAAVATLEGSLRHAPAWILLIGLPITLWYGTRFFVVLESVLCVIFRRRQRTWARQNRMALLMLLLFATLLPVIVLSTTVVPHIGLPATRYAAISGVSQTRLGDNPWLAVASFAASLAANFVLLLAAYTYVTPGRVPLRAAWPGALAGACLAQLYLLIFPLYVRDVLHPDHFGTVAGFALVAITFFFAYALFVVIGAELASWRLGCLPARQDIPATLADAALADAPAGLPMHGTARPTPAASRPAAFAAGDAERRPTMAPGWPVWVNALPLAGTIVRLARSRGRLS
ncbi:MAG TPA: YhjD/YihY/BrkB family envelope integrity protein [Ktedonobacterales bacterium]|nr:YhjD/YihY/BrkB family envelope integrity protein [Ktedonobacterales bacterium]